MNNMLLKNQWFTNKIKEEIKKKYLQTNGNVNKSKIHVMQQKSF